MRMFRESKAYNFLEKCCFHSRVLDLDPLVLRSDGAVSVKLKKKVYIYIPVHIYMNSYEILQDVTHSMW